MRFMRKMKFVLPAILILLISSLSLSGCIENAQDDQNDNDNGGVVDDVNEDDEENF